MPDSVVFYAIALVAVLLTGISKSGLGGGAGGLAVPLLSLVMPPAKAAAIMLPILCLMDLFSVRAYWGKWDRPNLAMLAPGAVVGIAAGGAAFGLLDPAGLRLLIGSIAIVFCLHAWLRRGNVTARPARPLSGVFWGAIAGFTSCVAHAGGPPYNMHMLPQRLDRTTFVATSVLFFLLVNYLKLVPYAALDLLDGSNLATSALLAPLAPIGIWLGLQLHKRIDDRIFYRITYALLLATGCKLVWDGVSGLI